MRRVSAAASVPEDKDWRGETRAGAALCDGSAKSAPSAAYPRAVAGTFRVAEPIIQFKS